MWYHVGMTFLDFIHDTKKREIRRGVYLPNRGIIYKTCLRILEGFSDYTDEEITEYLNDVNGSLFDGYGFEMTRNVIITAMQIKNLFYWSN